MKVNRVSQWAQQILDNFRLLRRPVEMKDGVLYANAPVDVTISFKAGDTKRTNLGGFFKVKDVASLSAKELEMLFKDVNRNGVYDGIERGILQPLYSDSTHVNGRWLEAMSPTFYTETKQVTYPLDVLFLIDNSGSYWDDINTMRKKAQEIVEALHQTTPDVRFGLATFGGHNKYRKILDFTPDPQKFQEAINKMFASGWNEKQLHAFEKAITDFSWRKDAVKTIAFSTDESFDDKGGTLSIDKVANDLKANKIKVLSLIPNAGRGARNDSKAIAEKTGGYFFSLSSGSSEIVDKLKEGINKIIEEQKVTYEKLTGGMTVHLEKGEAIVFYLASGTNYDAIQRDSILFSTQSINGILATRTKMLSPKEYELYWEDSAAVGGNKDFNDVILKIELKGEGLEKSSYSMGKEAIIAKRSMVGNSVRTIKFGNKAVTIFIPVLDTTEIVDLTFGKYQRLMPKGVELTATVPLSAIPKAVSPSKRPIAETIEIVNPGKPVRPNRLNFVDPATGKLDKKAYRAAMASYKKALAAYKAALKEYKAAVKAAKLEAKGQVKSLRVEQKAIKVVNKALAKLVKGEQKADRYITKAELSLQRAAEFRRLAGELRAKASERAKNLLGENWTMEALKAKLVRPNKSDFMDPTGKLDKGAYKAAMAVYKEARAIVKLFAKADKYELKAGRLEERAELYQRRAVELTERTVERFKSTLESLVSNYTARAKSLKASGEGLLARAQGLSGVEYYRAEGRGVYELELAEGYARGAEIATAVLESYLSVDVTVSPEVANSLDSVDISNVNVSI